MNTRQLALAATVLALSPYAIANETIYKVGSGSKAQQIGTVESVTDLETFTGRTDEVSGEVRLDLAENSVLGRIVVNAKSIKTGIDLRDEHMRSPMWLDTERFGTIEFVATQSKLVKKNVYAVTGKMTLHGVTKVLTTNVTIKQLSESETTRAANFKGDVLQLKSTFKAKLSDFGVQIPKMAAAKVSDEVTISVTVYGQTGQGQ